MNTTKYKSVEITANYSLNKFREYLVKNIESESVDNYLSLDPLNKARHKQNQITFKNCLNMFDFYYEAVQDNNKFNNK